VVVRTGTAPPRTLSISPRHPRDQDSPEDRIHATPTRANVPVDGIVDALATGAARTWGEIRNVFRVIARFFSGDISFQKNVSGPISIARLSSASASAGWGKFLAFLGFISVNLAVLNILPVPILDGGTVVLLIAEKIRRRPLPESAVAKAQLVGM